ncbi:hypothetical protein B0H13DRAFT_2653002 [Mycena leptocephala]|nr:hypothetical protein B0H13DRAFT_2653002 [Mycena leptocephala]
MEKVEIADSFWHLDTGPRSMVRPRVSLFAVPPCRPTRQVTCPHLRSCVFAAAGVGPRPPPSRSVSPSSPLSPSDWSTSAHLPPLSGEQDRTDYSLPVLVRTRALQMHRHMLRPFSSVVGPQGGLARI